MCGPAEAAGYRRFVDFVSQLYRLEMRDFIDRNIDSPLDLLRPSLARLAAIGGFRRLAPKVGVSSCTDERTQRVFSFQAMYAGLSPYDALAIYAVIGYMDSVAGRVLPARRDARGAAGAGRRGREARRRAAVRRDGDPGRAARRRGPWRCTRRPASGSPCDAVVLNPDLPVARAAARARPCGGG